MFCQKKKKGNSKYLSHNESFLLHDLHASEYINKLQIVREWLCINITINI